jgi:hypothetical protein
VRRLIKIALIVLGIRWFLRWRKRRREDAAQLEATPSAVTDPADELRQKLAASRAGEEPDEPEAAPEATVEDRRAEVHEQGRAAVDEMTQSDEG